MNNAIAQYRIFDFFFPSLRRIKNEARDTCNSFARKHVMTHEETWTRANSTDDCKYRFSSISFYDTSAWA